MSIKINIKMSNFFYEESLFPNEFLLIIKILVKIVG